MKQSIRLTNYQILRKHQVINPSIFGETYYAKYYAKEWHFSSLSEIRYVNPMVYFLLLDKTKIFTKKQSFFIPNQKLNVIREDLSILSFSPISDSLSTCFLLSTAPS